VRQIDPGAVPRRGVDLEPDGLAEQRLSLSFARQDGSGVGKRTHDSGRGRVTGQLLDVPKCAAGLLAPAAERRRLGQVVNSPRALGVLIGDVIAVQHEPELLERLARPPVAKCCQPSGELSSVDESPVPGLHRLFLYLGRDVQCGLGVRWRVSNPNLNASSEATRVVSQRPR
jgi:hypothetical protein